MAQSIEHFLGDTTAVSVKYTKSGTAYELPSGTTVKASLRQSFPDGRGLLIAGPWSQTLGAAASTITVTITTTHAQAITPGLYDLELEADVSGAKTTWIPTTQIRVLQGTIA